MKVLREFGLGIIWAFLAPFILVACALIAIYGVFNFFVQLIILLINFFKGEKLFPLFPEEKKAMEVYQKAIEKANGTEEKKEPAPQQIYVQQNFYSSGPAPLPGQFPNQIGGELPQSGQNPVYVQLGNLTPQNGQKEEAKPIMLESFPSDKQVIEAEETKEGKDGN